MKTTIKVTIDVSWEDLKDFLEKRNLLESYVKNRINYKGEGKAPFSNDLIPESWISSAFTWVLTPEKEDFWATVSHEWVCYLQREVLQNLTGNEKRIIDYRWDGDPLHSLIDYYHSRNLQGRRYEVRDNSWNREVQDQDPELWENDDKTWRSLVINAENAKKGCLILSEYPETKMIKWKGMGGRVEILERRFIKVLVPGTNKIQWVLFDPNWVKTTNKV